MKSRSAAILAGGIALSFAPWARGALTIDLDFSLDSNNFFNASTPNGQAARAALLRASQMLGDRIVDNLSPVAPALGDTWTTKFTHPATGVADFGITNLSIPGQTMMVFAGGRHLDGGAIGLGGPGGYTGSGSQIFLDALQYRGQGGAQLATPTDFGPWGGSIAFDNTVSWNFNLSGPAPGKNDFFTVALHEMAHVLGFGTSRSWGTFRAGNLFTGPKSKAVNGGANVPLYDLEVPSSHWKVGTKSTVVSGGALQEAAMTPSILVGTRKLFTLLDFAGMDDIGWDIARPGDANADGTVDFTDLVALAQNYNASEPLMRWSQGDFTYDGSVNFADLVLLAQNYNTTGVMGSPVDVAGALGVGFSEEWAAAQAVAGVPEPGALLGVAGAVLGRRRRCR